MVVVSDPNPRDKPNSNYKRTRTPKFCTKGVGACPHCKRTRHGREVDNCEDLLIDGLISDAGRCDT